MLGGGSQQSLLSGCKIPRVFALLHTTIANPVTWIAPIHTKPTGIGIVRDWGCVSTTHERVIVPEMGPWGLVPNIAVVNGSEIGKDVIFVEQGNL